MGFFRAVKAADPRRSPKLQGISRNPLLGETDESYSAGFSTNTKISAAKLSPQIIGVLNRLTLMPPQPRPTNGILVAMIVMNWTFASSGRLAIYTTARATCSTSKVGSTASSPDDWGTPCAIRAVISDAELTIPI